ncbi:thermonuclease family protein [Microvirga flavescens]|uniref:thermonuclease family protein n=1 Tax=Microvirga flavescens TaxID=2249811 RepID=UPI000DDAA8E3|nr:thermonuclease family protein [Microvirga flavescens]
MRRFAHRSQPRGGNLRGFLAALIAIGLAALAGALFEPSEREIAGRAFAVDGDTLRIEGKTIRLKGIDAPELHQSCRRQGRAYRCGEAARQALADMVADRIVECSAAGRDRYQRVLASCTVEGEDIAARLVGDGQALSYGDYRFQEARARLSGVGLWAGEFERPQDWRQQNGR